MYVAGTACLLACDELPMQSCADRVTYQKEKSHVVPERIELEHQHKRALCEVGR